MLSERKRKRLNERMEAVGITREVLHQKGCGSRPFINKILNDGEYHSEAIKKMIGVIEEAEKEKEELVKSI